MSSGTLLYSGHPEICFMPSHQSINKTCNKMKKLYDLEFLLIETSFSKSLIPNEWYNPEQRQLHEQWLKSAWILGWKDLLNFHNG